MKLFLKQLFCEHIWKFISEEYLCHVTKYLYNVKLTGEFDDYAVNQKCLKCDKKRIITSRRPA